MQMINNTGTNHSLAGNVLVATPQIQGSCFERSVIYMCAHNEAGAMGIVVNNAIENVEFSEVLSQLSIEHEGAAPSFPLHFGGPVEPNRGFILHSSDVLCDDSVVDHNGIALTASMNLLEHIAKQKGPEHGMLLLGYAGWSPQQLESEIEEGSWIVLPASKALLFQTDNEHKWDMAISTLGIDMGHFSTDVGHA